MIEDFEINVSLGYSDQVGLFVRADDKMAQRFRNLLWRNGLNSIPYLPSKVDRFTHFTYVSLPDSNLDKQGVYQRLRPLCEQHCLSAREEPSTAPDYTKWRQDFQSYVASYSAQRVPKPDKLSEDAFDKAYAYNLIRSSSYEQAEIYLNRFATDTPPALVPAYLVYLYHEWHRPDQVAEVHRQYAAHLHAGDVDHRVIEWVVSAYLRLSPPKPEQALATLDIFLPEFQRQGVAERLLGLRAQARALQGRLPETMSDLQSYINRAPSEKLTEQLSDLLEVISGLQASASEIEALLDKLAACIEPKEQWQIELEKSALARRSGNREAALTHLSTVLSIAPSTLDDALINTLRLDIAGLHLDLCQPQRAMTWLEEIVPERLKENERRAYWRLRGLALVTMESPDALEALHHAYQLGGRQPDVLQPLARLAYRTEDWDLAQQIYAELIESGFEASIEDQLYAGILAWLGEEPYQAVKLLENAIPTLSQKSDPSSELLIAHEALTESLRSIGSSPENVARAISDWTDTLMALNDQDGLERLAVYIPEASLDRETAFALLEAIEPVLDDHTAAKENLAQAYAQLLYDEVDIALRQGKKLPDYTLDLRRGLFQLDRERFDFIQEYLQDELGRARDAELVEADFDLEPPDEPALDLSDRWVALIGGYEPVRRRVGEILAQDYDLGRFTEVPPSWEARVDQNRVAEAVRGADLIVVVHRCLKHDETDALRAVVEGTALEERVRYADGKGQSSILRSLRGYFQPNKGHRGTTEGVSNARAP